MRTRKVRGHKRCWKKIENWKKLSLDLNPDYLVTYQKDYVKFRVRPWSSLSLRNSVYSKPKKRTKDEMISGLFDIYEQWKIQLDKLGKPYWLFNIFWFCHTHFATLLLSPQCKNCESFEFSVSGFGFGLVSF